MSDSICFYQYSAIERGVNRVDTGSENQKFMDIRPVRLRLKSGS